ncbi:GNAT family N-acetyltransferase [Streptomyces sp. JV176]|uniref:GNAT family N-acetyltransferase n=1 Tax=Streptomyces sp. JV176 TaxID=858630 RepID=UPI002E75FA71|nr:GNAT family N-acetyltransferase [Streptomyces sp. JV176]MEE1800845.1 GNAT family N-acetyltransferase [Streptomyces sp. JV176]
MDDLVTERLVLHPLSALEAERVAAGEPADGDRWAPGYPTEGDVAGARRFLTTCSITGDPRPFGAYEIRRRADGHAIGGLGFHGVPDEDLAVTIGYGLIPSAHGQGYASEALRGLLRFARAGGVSRVQGDADHDNIASQRVMTAVGMRLVAQDEALKYYRIVWPVDEAAADALRSWTDGRRAG